jgi:hypothetical protein
MRVLLDTNILLNDKDFSAAPIAVLTPAALIAKL